MILHALHAQKLSGGKWRFKRFIWQKVKYGWLPIQGGGDPETEKTERWVQEQSMKWRTVLTGWNREGRQRGVSAMWWLIWQFHDTWSWMTKEEQEVWNWGETIGHADWSRWKQTATKGAQVDACRRMIVMRSVEVARCERDPEVYCWLEDWMRKAR